MTRQQELQLIELGLDTLLGKIKTKRKYKKHNGKIKWSKERHKKYAETMAKRWGKNRAKSI